MKRVLFVDDDEAILELYRQVFQMAGYQVSTCTTMEAARRHLEQTGADAVVLDIRLAEGLGLALLRELKARDPKLPVILATAYARYQDDFSSWLADEYVVKSADLAELKRALHRCLGEAP
ncbi:MAG: response regulator [Thermoanaerobaculum sp.]|nr:response regulator [Thermoanaerobaculum sp.]